MTTRLKRSLQKKAAAKESLRKHREKIYSDPTLLEEYRRKERERYQQRKLNGKLKSVGQMTAIEHARQKSKWRKNFARHYKKKKDERAILDLTPSFEEPQLPISSDPLVPQEPLFDAHRPGPRQHESTPTPKKKSVISKLRMKLREADKKLANKDRELINMKKKLARLTEHKERGMTANTGIKRRLQLPHNRRQQLKARVWSFLNRDDNSTVRNGKSGEVRRQGQIYRRRRLNNTMTCLHKKFLQDHPDNTISFAQFCKLRPFWITAPKSSERETCACKIHENFKFKVMKLHQSGITPMKTPTDVVARTVCAISNKLCMYGQCTDCTQKKKPDLNLDPSTKNNTVTFEEWMTRTVPITRKNQDGSSYEVEMRSTVLDKRSTTIEKLVEMVYDDLPKFCIHIYNISHQFERLHYLKNTLTNAETVIHIDYSENYACKYATEIQDMHFAPGKQQVSLHTGVRYLSGGRVECFCSVSSCVRHDACATWAHLEPVLKKLRDEHPEVNTIHFMSDGPTSQYRNKTNFYLTSSVPFLMGFQHVTWNFSEASHGKGAPDGVGGALKNLADRIVSYGTNIPDADSLYNELTSSSSIKIFQISEEDVMRSSERVPPSLKALPGTMRVHQLVSSSPGVVKIRELSCFCDRHCDCYQPKEFSFAEKELEPQEETPDDIIRVGTWVLVRYDGDLYPGTVTQIEKEQFEVDAMYSAGENKFFSSGVNIPGDKVWYYRDDIVAVIPEPLPITSSARHFCVLPEIWMKHAKKH